MAQNRYQVAKFIGYDSVVPCKNFPRAHKSSCPTSTDLVTPIVQSSKQTALTKAMECTPEKPPVSFKAMTCDDLAHVYEETRRGLC